MSKRAAQKTENGLSASVNTTPALNDFQHAECDIPWGSDFSARRSLLFAKMAVFFISSF